jgi:hypothetical protein
MTEKYMEAFGPPLLYELERICRVPTWYFYHTPELLRVDCLVSCHVFSDACAIGL